MPVDKFQELRYSVASVLKEMEDLEERNFLKIDTWNKTGQSQTLASPKSTLVLGW